MKRISLAILGAGALLLPALAGAETWEDQVARGDVVIWSHKVPGGDEPEVLMRAVINVPRRRVFELLRDCAAYTRTMPRIAAARVDQREPNSDICTVTVDMPFPYSDLTATCRSVYTIDETKLVRTWSLIKGDYKQNQGSWTLTAFKGDPNRTLIFYRTISVPNTRGVPGFIKSYATKGALKDTIQLFRKALGAPAQVAAR